MPHSTDHHHDHPHAGLLAGAVVDPESLLQQRQALRARRGRQRLAAAAVAFVVFTALAVLAAQVGLSDTTPNGAAPPSVAVTAESTGVLVLRPGRDAERLAHARPVVGVADTAQGAHATYELPGLATVERATTSAKLAVRTRTATSTAAVERIDLLAGRVQLTGARMVATSASADGRAAGTVVLDPAATLMVDGQPRELSVNQRIAIEGVGTVIVNEQAVVANAPNGDAQTGPRHRIVGAIAHVRLTQAAFGLPAGSELVIGRVDAGVREGKVRAVTHPGSGQPTPLPTPPISGIGQLQAGTPKPGETTLPRRPVSVRGNGAGISGPGLSGYLFPVLGTADYTNDWGAPRASTGVPHQGTDIFAEEGTPIVAIADGVLDRVGWNSIGGYRFWLFDQYGNSFYHAHLSAFSPLAIDGARVKRGDVIGFVGNTGDAQGTPPHLHFEVHPGNGAPTNPFPLLGAWQQGLVVAIGLITSGPERVAPLTLLGFSDISANSGLGDSVLGSVPDRSHRHVEGETEPQPTAKTLKAAIDGPGTSAR